MAAMDEEKEETTTTTTTTKNKEGANLLGAPTFTDLQNGRFRCVETGHELLEKDKESYSQSKRCRLGLIEYALTHKKPPLNMFKQNPTSRSKLICKLTGDTVNKSEEHIWKHINGRRFLNKLEEKELENASNGMVLEEGEEKKSGEEHSRKEEKKKKKEKNKKKEEKTDDVANEVDGHNDDKDDSQEPNFWMPPVGDRWDFDDGGDRWGSGSDSEEENEEQNPTGEDDDEDGDRAADEVSLRRRRKTKEVNSNGLSLEKKDKDKKNKKKIRTHSEA